MEIQGKPCRVCTRCFYGDEYRVENGICQYCQAEIDKGKTEECVAFEQRTQLAKTIKGFKSIRAYNREFNDEEK